MLKVLSIAGIAAASLIALIIVLIFIILLLNLTFIIKYKKDGLLVKLKILFFKYKLIPQTEKKNKKDKKKDKDKEEEEKKSLLKMPNFNIKNTDDIFELLHIIENFFKEYLKPFIKKIKIKKAHISITAAGKDAAEAAINYGRLCAAFYPVAGIIQSFTKLKKSKMRIDCNYNTKKIMAETELIVSIRIIHIVAFALKSYVFMRNNLPDDKTEDTAEEIKKENK